MQIKCLYQLCNYYLGIELEPNNQSMWSALRICQEAYEKDKKTRFASAAVVRQVEEERLRKADEALQILKEKSAEEQKAKSAAEEESLLSSFLSEVTEEKKVGKPEDSLLEGFFSEIFETKAEVKPLPVSEVKALDETSLPAARDETQLTAKYVNEDLGDGRAQVERLTGPNYKWKNLNPYAVLQLDIDATEEDIRYRYKKLSTKVHPDKIRDMESAREAFEEVRCL